jgi:hypothetical protein
MNVADLIEKLQKLLEQHGNVPVVLYDYNTRIYREFDYPEASVSGMNEFPERVGIPEGIPVVKLPVFGPL